MYPAFTAVCTAQRAVCLYRTEGYIAGSTHDNGNSCYISDTLPAVVKLVTAMTLLVPNFTAQRSSYATVTTIQNTVTFSKPSIKK